MSPTEYGVYIINTLTRERSANNVDLYYRRFGIMEIVSNNFHLIDALTSFRNNIFFNDTCSHLIQSSLSNANYYKIL